MRRDDDFVIGDWLVQPSLDRVSRDGATVHLRPKAMDVLVCLAASDGRIVSREALIDQVWAKEFVSDSALKTTVWELRDAFGDTCRRPRFIETVPKRGYRLLQQPRPATTEPARDIDLRRAPFQLILGDRRIPVGDGQTLIGRDPGCDVRLDSHLVSRRHARITVSSGRAVIEDLGSKNGTYLDGRRLDSPTELENAGKLIIGTTVLVFVVVGLRGTTESGEYPRASVVSHHQEV